MWAMRKLLISVKTVEFARYRIFGIAVDRNLTLKWLFSFRGPRRQVFVAGVEVKATFNALKRTTFIPKML
jgi:hypothetical protein